MVWRALEVLLILPVVHGGAHAGQRDAGILGPRKRVFEGRQIGGGKAFAWDPTSNQDLPSPRHRPRGESPNGVEQKGVKLKRAGPRNRPPEGIKFYPGQKKDPDAEAGTPGRKSDGPGSKKDYRSKKDRQARKKRHSTTTYIHTTHIFTSHV